MTEEMNKKAPEQHAAVPASAPEVKAGNAMNVQNTNRSKPSASVSVADDTGLPLELQGHLGRHLRTVYRELVETPVPDKFLKLLEKLEKSERPPEDGK
jgi:Anti-sigma factor NepR